MGDSRPVAVIGGGLAGLTASLLLSKAGLPTTVYEASGALGGRARTQHAHGYRLNLGPHALYLHGRTVQTLRGLGMQPAGGRVPASAFWFLEGGELLAGPWARRRPEEQPVADSAEASELATVMAAVHRDAARAKSSQSFREWRDQLQVPRRTREILAAMARLATYAADDKRQAADAALAQLAVSRGGVLYADGGWGRLVERLASEAARAGVRFEEDQVTRVVHDDAVHGVETGSGSRQKHSAVIVAAGGPRDAARLLSDNASDLLEEHAAAVTPVRAATLDVALDGVSVKPRVVIGLDTPLYLSPHSVWADLSPDGGSVVHVARYLVQDEHGDEVLDSLEQLLDLAVPSWRTAVVHRRHLPRMTVAHDLPAAKGGLGSRPHASVPGVGGCYVAGDWVGPEGLLADAAVASAVEASQAILREHAQNLA